MTQPPTRSLAAVVDALRAWRLEEAHRRALAPREGSEVPLNDGLTLIGIMVFEHATDMSEEPIEYSDESSALGPFWISSAGSRWRHRVPVDDVVLRPTGKSYEGVNCA